VTLDNLDNKEAETGYNAVANRAYYAVFQAAVASLLKLTDYRPARDWDHGAVQAEFVTRLIARRKVLSRDLRGILPELMILTITADYRPFMISRRQADRALRRAEPFLEAVAHAVEEA
jgi:uncharacterized protein (UPF0332 family)